MCSRDDVAEKNRTATKTSCDSRSAPAHPEPKSRRSRASAPDRLPTPSVSKKKTIEKPGHAQKSIIEKVLAQAKKRVIGDDKEDGKGKTAHGQRASIQDAHAAAHTVQADQPLSQLGPPPIPTKPRPETVH
jgi:hypothetical protein